MSRICDVCNKGVVYGKQRSHAENKSSRTWVPNLKKVKVMVNGTPKTLKVCTSCLRSGKVERA
ncbi:LSU ribosomal protein L28P [Hathewaya proteolytica DSM 3090]|uniref:Large ribosomal subunit protein bL28 n=1 Tax=Hathewaya proteolytica DSM 3090 TaxID=1121331 RepID=A0A1M6JA11_9CLOT|nr:50S ribosomal protein L28 [Hathewaya proteolytica]SHJ43490.1 LSU ribosomal protein L28P [Hathewaya proteolytica DSM 3090]